MSSTKLVHLISSRVLALIAALALTMLSFTARSFRANGFFRTTKTVFSCRAAYSARYSSHADAAEAEFCAEMEHRLKLTIDSMRIPTNSSILLCVSGGSDSVALLVLMDQLRKQYLPSLSLSVVNYNHKLRSESDEEVSRSGNYNCSL